MFGSDVSILSTSMQEKVKVRWGKTGAVGRLIQSLSSQATNVFFCVPCCILHYRPRTKFLNSSLIRLSSFPCIEVSTTSLPNMLIHWSSGYE
ncbi:hypothetical protein AVEN_120404-1 [Araneus ventricosus]|uniref:Uncharacterized protein n=1 Tax=Araneus ventricosus TaxID=182803 RepID=A0A4Y2U8K3_ARAVE|nr:hypothetical protein AVEN_120404-1 [Araneus ventricosus]